MVTQSNRARNSRQACRQEAREIIPSPAKVRAMAAEIRNSWTPDERRRRAFLARHVALDKLMPNRE